MISWITRGSTKKTDAFLGKLFKQDVFSNLERYAEEGVVALRAATPKDSGETAAGWGYKVSKRRGKYIITWTIRIVVSGVPIAIILQYGHATGTGGWVAGRDYINPAMRPTFDSIANKVWKAVTSA